MTLLSTVCFFIVTDGKWIDTELIELELYRDDSVLLLIMKYIVFPALACA